MLQFMAGSTNTAEALYMLRTRMMTSANGNRKNAKNVVVVLTDGASNVFPEYTAEEAKILRKIPDTEVSTFRWEHSKYLILC